MSAFVAILVMGYDIGPWEGEGLDLEQDMKDMSLGLGSLKGKFLVQIVPRRVAWFCRG